MAPPNKGPAPSSTASIISKLGHLDSTGTSPEWYRRYKTSSSATHGAGHPLFVSVEIQNAMLDAERLHVTEVVKIPHGRILDPGASIADVQMIVGIALATVNPPIGVEDIAAEEGSRDRGPALSPFVVEPLDDPSSLNVTTGRLFVCDRLRDIAASPGILLTMISERIEVHLPFRTESAIAVEKHHWPGSSSSVSIHTLNPIHANTYKRSALQAKAADLPVSCAFAWLILRHAKDQLVVNRVLTRSNRNRAPFSENLGHGFSAPDGSNLNFLSGRVP